VLGGSVEISFQGGELVFLCASHGICQRIYGGVFELNGVLSIALNPLFGNLILWGSQ
jgi:hypothetical protein